MGFSLITAVVILDAACTSLPAFASPPGPARVSASNAGPRLHYLQDIRPILAANCFPCHGMDDKKRQAGLRLDQSDGAYARSSYGERAVAPGKPAESALMRRITATGALKMPPEGSGKRLSPADIDTLRRWIAQGAEYAPHWAFLKPVQPPQPVLKNDFWSRNGVDRFILAGLKSAGLSPAPEADRYTLIRRLSIDLIGLPPSPKEVDEFLSDSSHDAYDKLVDRLLASPHFGEKWARSWLDLARFADSSGYGSDPLRPNLWPYRDWVIGALNENMPYDQFITEQIAGDLLPKPTQDQMIATAFNRNTMTNTEGGTDREEFRTAAIKDRAATTAQAVMGLTLGCAQCHSHKFDPITNKEYYRFVAIFNQTADNDQPDEKPTMPLLTTSQVERQAALTAEIDRLQKQTPIPPDIKARLEQAKKDLADIKPVNIPIMQELPADKRRQSYMLVLGNFLNRGEPVEPGVPSFFAGSAGNAVKNRLTLAHWLVSPDNPLTARVAVNRIWAQLFGTGIVETEEDFGQQGALPSNQPLLDWLAYNFMHTGNLRSLPSILQGVGNTLSATGARVGDNHWDVKSLIRLLVMSTSYRQSSRVSAAVLEKDPRDRLISRYPRRRLSAEGVRDQALALSGLLSGKIGGPSVFPPQPGGLWQAAFNGDRTYPTSTGEDRYRRGIYTFWRRTVPPPNMAAFDAPSREICTFRRMPTNTPLQALVTLNDPIYVEAAQAMGRRLVREGGSTPESRAHYALRLALGRPPAADQLKEIFDLYKRELARYRTDPDSAKKLAADPLGPLPAGADPAEMASWTVVCSVLLNMDSVLTVH